MDLLKARLEEALGDYNHHILALKRAGYVVLPCVCYSPVTGCSYLTHEVRRDTFAGPEKDC